MKNAAFLIPLVAMISCIRDEAGSPTTITIANNSEHTIILQQTILGDSTSSVIIENNKEVDFTTGGGAGNGRGQAAPPFPTDSIWVKYANKASIWHTADVNSPVTKSLMLESSYEGGKVRDRPYEFTYTFTPEDFEEALEFGD